jgi:alginate O-acetyltransferase complex protein AlgI
LLLPLAIRFFTFQQIVFPVESYRMQRSDSALLHYANIIPHLIAGPIVRRREIVPQLVAADIPTPRLENLAEGSMIFLLGLAKQLVLADTFASFADVGFNAAALGAPLSCAEAKYAAAVYALGLATMLHARFPLTFASPYQAANIREFWTGTSHAEQLPARSCLHPAGCQPSRRGQAQRQPGDDNATGWSVARCRLELRIVGPIARDLSDHSCWLPTDPHTDLHILRADVGIACRHRRLGTFRASGLDASLVMLRCMAGWNSVALPRMIVHALTAAESNSNTPRSAALPR